MKKKYYVSAGFLTVLFLFSPLNSRAEEESQSVVPGSPVNAVSGSAGLPFPEGVLSATINYRYAETEGLYLGNDKQNNNVERTKNIGVLKFRYGILPGFDVRTCTPFYTMNFKNNSTGSDLDRDGVGDTSVVFHKELLNQKKGAPFFMSADIGGFLPTANVDSETVDSMGNQAWGGLLGLGFTWIHGAQRIDQEFNYATFTEGEDDYRHPQRYRANTTWTMAMNPTLDIGLESTWEYDGESEVDGEGMDNATQEWYAGPKVGFRISRWKMYIGSAVMFPVYRDYDATTPSDEYRLEVKVVKNFKLL